MSNFLRRWTRRKTSLRGKTKKNDVEIQDLPDSNDSELDRNQRVPCVAGGLVRLCRWLSRRRIFTSRANRTASYAGYQGEDDAVRSEPLVESSNAITCTNNIEIVKCNNVTIGDHTTITVPPLVRQSGERMNTLRNAEGFQAIVEPGDRESVDEEIQISARPVDTNNITVRDSDIVAIGDKIEIYLQISDEMFTSDFQIVSLKEALNFDQHRRTDQNNWRGVRVVLLPGLPLRSELSQLPSPGVDRRVRTAFKRMSEIVDQLYPLRDCGKWQEFGDALNRLHRTYDSHPEINCFLLLEESIKLTYQKNLKEAKKKAEESLQMIGNEANKIDGVLRDVLRALAKIALASIYRRLPIKKLGKAFQCLRDAMKSSARLKLIGNLPIPNFVLALLDYEQARFYMEFAAVQSDTKCCNREATKFLGLCIDRCRALSDNNQLYTAKQMFSLIYLARLSLPSATRQSQPGCQMIKKQCARQAEKHLKEYERSHAEGSPVAARVKYLMTKTELCFLNKLKDYTDAEDHARHALKIAMKYGFELEIIPAQNHLDRICRCCAFVKANGKLQRVKDLSNNYSSSTTTDSDQKYNVERAT